MDEEMLIMEVQNHQILYDPTHPFIRTTVEKRTHGRYCQRMEVDVKLCKEKWRSLRDSFVKSRKKSALPSGSGAGVIKEWKFEKIISFILPYLQPRSSRSNLDIAQQEELDQPGTSVTGEDSRDISSHPLLHLCQSNLRVL
ncbi:hypothetical protein WMY93_009720 [Mugilogobius chulae]|uniref:MADF domain-containing protein n=1 Tax=Mugilogobius chulae TaxID=88201 RepID=A0AAW0PCA2_9GOBI